MGGRAMEKHERFTHEGIELLRVRISLPSLEDVDAVHGFWVQMTDAAYAFCHDRLMPYAIDCYERDPDPKKRLHFAPFRYRLWGETRYRSDTLLSVLIEASLSREGAGQRRQYFCDAQNFSLPDGCLLSPRDALSLYLGEPVSKKRCKHVKSLLLTERVAYAKHGDTWQIFCEKEQ